MPTQEKETLEESLIEFQQWYDAMFVLLDAYPKALRLQSGACGVWSAKQTVDHLSGWIVEALSRYAEYNKETYDPKIYDDFDSFNAASVDARVNQSWDESVAELHRLRDELSAAAKAVTEAQLNHTIGYTEWLNTLAEDVEQHTEQLYNFMQGASTV
jgi:hypothetical protein